MNEPVNTPLGRLEKVESSLLALLQELHSIKAEIQNQANGNGSLEPLLEAEEVARILGVELAYVYTQARAGKIPSVKLGKYRKFSPSHLKRWLDRKNNP